MKKKEEIIYKLNSKELDLLCDCYFLINVMKILKQTGEITDITYNAFKRVLDDYLNIKKRCI